VQSLVHQQPALALDSAPESSERAVRADHSVTGHDDRDRIAVVGAADRARRSRLADGAREAGLKF